MIERGGHAESLDEVVEELGAEDGFVDSAITRQIEAPVVVPCSDGFGLVGAFNAFVGFALQLEDILLVEPANGLEECFGIIVELLTEAGHDIWGGIVKAHTISVGGGIDFEEISDAPIGPVFGRAFEHDPHAIAEGRFVLGESSVAVDSGNGFVYRWGDLKGQIDSQHEIRYIRNQVAQGLEEILFVVRSMGLKPAFVVIGLEVL